IKYSSASYGPVRDAEDRTPQVGDRKQYQMGHANHVEAIREAASDVKDVADLLIVKQAVSYLDVIRDGANNFKLPVLAYNGSGEYSMVKAAAINGWVDEKAIVMEEMLSMKRAGANLILTYHAKDIARWINNK